MHAEDTLSTRRSARTAARARLEAECQSGKPRPRAIERELAGDPESVKARACAPSVTGGEVFSRIYETIYLTVLDAGERRKSTTTN